MCKGRAHLSNYMHNTAQQRKRTLMQYSRHNRGLNVAYLLDLERSFGLSTLLIFLLW